MIDDLSKKLARLKVAVLPLIVDENNRNLFFLFVIGFCIRSIPNLLTPYPIGYDTIDYANTILSFQFDLHSLLTYQTPLFIIVTSFLHSLLSIHPFIILRFLQPLLYGLLIMSFYYAAKGISQWNMKWAMISAIIFCFQTTTLRLSWDLLRNELGLSLLLLALPKFTTPKSYSFIILSLLLVLSHELTSVLFFVILLGLVFRNIFNGNNASAKALILTALPSMILFVSIFSYRSLLPVDATINVSNNFTLPKNQHPFFPFVNYLAGEWTVDYEGSYLYLLLDVGSVYLASFLPLMPFLLLYLKFYKVTQHMICVDLWAGFCTLVFLNCVIYPTFALVAWHRWMFLLLIPYSIYVIEGIRKVSEKKMFNISYKKMLVIVTCSIYFILAILYLSSSYINPLSLPAIINPASKYSPTTMLRHTTPIEDTFSVTQAFHWINQNCNNSTCIMLSDAFADWAKLNVHSDIPIINYRNKKVNEGLDFALLFDYPQIYWVWWENGVGLEWYGQSIPEVFSPVFQANNIFVYKYTPFEN